MDKKIRESNIYLIGMMGVGKTTVGKLLAQKLNYRFFDTDDLIEKLAQKTISEIFATDTEAGFRELESQVLKRLSSDAKNAFTEGVSATITQEMPAAIATGGGIVQRKENWKYLRQGLIVWLDADLNLLNQRLAQDNSRPLARQLESLLKARRPLYRQADIRISLKAEQTPEEIVTQIIYCCQRSN